MPARSNDNGRCAEPRSDHAPTLATDARPLVKGRHRAGIKPVHANGEPCPHRKGEACPGREYRAQCKNAGCRFDKQLDARVQLEFVRDTSACPTGPSSAYTDADGAANEEDGAEPVDERSQRAAPPLPLQPQIRKTGPTSKPYRLTCPEQDCGRLGDYPNRRMASVAFGEHVDLVHPALTPLDLVRKVVQLQEDGVGRWAVSDLSGHRYTVRRIDEKTFRVDVDGRAVTVAAPLATLERARLCIAQLARIVHGSRAEAARIQLLREERAATAS
ncbi:hypothetical protein ACFV98_33010 [Streptomyces violascens]|uniref:hypothetical protein n=1 Tax=Streptomyces violascens TaxID=67381 RepID=UPI00365648DE